MASTTKRATRHHRLRLQFLGHPSLETASRVSPCSTPLVVASVLQDDVLRQLLPRKQQIGQTEPFARILPDALR